MHFTGSFWSVPIRTTSKLGFSSSQPFGESKLAKVGPRASSTTGVRLVPLVPLVPQNTMWGTSYFAQCFEIPCWRGEGYGTSEEDHEAKGLKKSLIARHVTPFHVLGLARRCAQYTSAFSRNSHFMCFRPLLGMVSCG